MASYEFIEEFDTDDEEPVIVNTQCATNIAPFQNALISSAPPSWGQYGNFSNSVPSNVHNFPQLCSYPPPSAFSSESFPQPPSSIVQIHDGQQSVPKRKRKRKKQQVRLTDFNPALKAFAWKKFETISRQKVGEGSLSKVKPSDSNKTPLPESTSLFDPSFSQEDNSNIRKLINKFKSQTAKRARQKKAKLSRRAARNKKSAEIDNWQMQQKNLFLKQREHEIFVQEAKTSLAQVRRKKHLLQDKIKLISSLEKLREVRRKQLINVEAGFSSDSVKVKSTQDFQSGMSSLKKRVEMALQSVTKEENMIALMAQPQHGEQQQRESSEKKSQEKITPDDKKARNERKWQKYLYKKMLKSQGFVSQV